MMCKTTFESMMPIYDITKTFEENLAQGPQFRGEIPVRKFPEKSSWSEFLGHLVATRFGVPAGPLGSAEWIKFAAQQLGFDILTYKTIRSHEKISHPVPNMIAIAPCSFKSQDPTPIVLAHESIEGASLSYTNSFGMPSRSLDFLAKDIPLAREALRDGQLLVVSVVGSTGSGRSLQKDFEYIASFAKEYGAQAIEMNFSCPNVGASAEGHLYSSPQDVLEISSAVVRAVAPLPVIVKLGYFDDPRLLRTVLNKAGMAGAAAVAGINTIRAKVVNRAGDPALGAGREISGICGEAIRELALKFVQDSRHIILDDKLPLALIGMGGVVAPEHYKLFRAAGADIVMSGAGMMWNPLLALKIQNEVGNDT